MLTALTAVHRPAWADDPDPFTATVTVDGTADTVVKAREKARVDGQRRALAEVVARLSGGGTAKLATLDDNAITNLVTSFAVADERMSQVRYTADYTFHFQPDAVRRLFGDAGGVAVGASDKPMVVLPVLQSGTQLRLWEDPNPWRDAWDQASAASGAPHFVVPLDDAGDLAAIDADKARAGDAAALAAVTQRNGGGDAIVALAATRGPPDAPTGIDVTLRRYRAGQLVGSHTASLNANPGEDAEALLRRAEAATAGGLASGWQPAPVAGYDQQGSLSAIMPITGLDDWVQAQRQIAGLPAIRKVALVALSRQEATIEIGYVGTIDALKAALAGISLDLAQGDPLWRLSRTGPSATR